MTLPSSSSIKLDSQQSPSTPKSRILVPGDSVEDSFEAPTPSSIELLQAPKPLSHWVFRDPNFDCDEFLYSRRLISLDDLRTELRDYLSGLKSELVGVINEDYEDFIGLGMGLRSTVEQTMGKLKVPLEELRKRVLLISQNLDQQRAEVEGLLSERRKVIDGKKLVRLMLDCGDAVTKVEGMLSIQQLSTSDQAVSPTKIIDSRAMARNRSSSSRYSVKLDLPLDSLEGSAVIEARAKRVERITNEYNQMLYLVSKGSNLAYVDQLKPRIELVTETLHRGLGSLFRSTLHTPRSDHRKRHCLLECLRAYEALEAVSEAEDIIKEELVVPGMSKIVHRNSLNPGAMSPVLPASPEVARFKIDSKNSSSNRFNTSTVTAKFLQLALPDDPEQVPLPLLYNKILAFIAREMALILDAADQLSKHSNQQLNNKDLLSTSNNSHSKPTYNILVNSIISPTLQLIVSTVGSSLFASGNPSTFHRNYSCTVNFLYRLEAFCSSPRQVLNLRAHPDWQNFRNKWQLPVYAQIRTKEMIYSIEDGLSDDLKHSETYSKTGGNLKDSKYLLRSSETVNRVISVLWQDDVFLTDLTHRFWRLTLMALSRYKTWLDRITSTYNLLDESDPSTLPQRASIESNRLKNTGSHVRDGINSNKTNQEGSSDEEKLRDMTIIMVDVLRFKEHVSKLFKHVIGPRLPDINAGNESKKPEDILKISLGRISSVVPLLLAQISMILVKRCSEKLRFIRTVGSSARASKSMPKEPSYFISDIFTDLRAYLNRFSDLLSSISTPGASKSVKDHQNNNIESKNKKDDDDENENENRLKNLKTRLIESTIEEIFNRYLNILINVQRSEDSLKKLKKGRKKQGFLNFNNNSNSSSSSSISKMEEEGRLRGVVEEEEEEDLRVKTQLRLDFKKLELDSIELGFVSLDQSKAFNELLKIL